MATQTLTDPQAEQTRVAVIDIQQEAFFTPDTWSLAPQSCAQSMTMIIPKDGHSSSGTILLEEKWTDPQGKDIWVYYLLVSNHAVSEKISPTYTLLPGDSTSLYKDYNTAYLNYYPIVATSGQIGIDSGILSVFSLARIDRENTKPLGIDKIKTGENLPLGNTNYFVFSYPGSTITAQFSIAIVKSSHPSEPYTLKLASTNTTTSPGSSGGAVCNQNGEVIAVVTGHIGNEAIEFIADPIPQNISYQIEMAIQNSRSILLTNNITQSP